MSGQFLLLGSVNECVKGFAKPATNISSEIGIFTPKRYRYLDIVFFYWHCSCFSLTMGQPP